MPSEVTLLRAGPDQHQLLANLLELYSHDLSDIFPVTLGPDGRFGYDKLPLYWSERERRHAFVITSGSRVAGFALVTRGSPESDDPTDYDVAEFFVLRAYRHRGVGREAAIALWDQMIGRWVVRVSEANQAALPFWRGVIRAYTSGAFVESGRPGDPHGWRVFKFRSLL